MKSKADLHVHTYYSDGLDKPEEIVTSAAAKELAVIAICDHNRIKGALQAKRFAEENLQLGVEVIIGEEISTLNGHILGLFLKEKIKPGRTAEATIALIHQQNGLAILPHPFHLYSGRKRGNMSAGRLMGRLPWDGVEVICNSSITSFWANMKASFQNVSLNLPAIGSSDAHDGHFLGYGYTMFEGRTAADLRACLRERRTTAHYRFWSTVDLLRFMRSGLQNLTRYYRGQNKRQNSRS